MQGIVGNLEEGKREGASDHEEAVGEVQGDEAGVVGVLGAGGGVRGESVFGVDRE